MTKILLDTHVLIWFAEGNTRLSASALKEIDDLSNSKFVSIASFWEIVIKSSSNKLEFKSTTKEVLEFCSLNNIKIIQIELSHLDILQALPHYHRDPFDRLLISQAIAENLTIISADQHFVTYPVTTIW